jgi:tetratricopeptide (TPR) repeat protein
MRRLRRLVKVFGGVVASPLVVWLALALLLAAPTVAWSGPRLDEALALYANYHRDRANLDRARDLLETELRQEPTLEAMLALAQVCFTIGDVRAGTEEAKLAAYDRGRAVAKRAVEVAPRNPLAHFLYGANTARWGQTKGIFRALFLLPTVKEEIRTIFEIDPNYPAGHALAGNVYLELPAVAGGSVATAEDHFQKALAVAPRYTAIRVGLARAFIRLHQYAAAREQLEAVVREREPAVVADWTVKDLPRAQRLLVEIQDKR